jgi:hypothetical protein
VFEIYDGQIASLSRAMAAAFSIETPIFGS